MALARRFDEEVNPNAYAVIQLKKGSMLGNGRYVQIEDREAHYDGIAKQLMYRASEKVFGRTAFRRMHSRLLPNLVTLEGDGEGKKYHLNLMVRRPDWLSWDDFRKAFQWANMKSEWTKRGKNAFFMEERTGDSPFYSLKTGPDSVLWASYTTALRHTAS